MMVNETTYIDAGVIRYEKSLTCQKQTRDEIIALKQAHQDTSKQHVLMLCEHNPVLTFGSSAKESELFVKRNMLPLLGMEIYDIKRGGAITFHGEGQITGYPILDLECFKRDIRWYIQGVAAVIIHTIAEYGISGYYDDAYPGVWIHDVLTGKKRKICAVGVHLSRWVSMHGFAFNVSTNLDYYRHFVPCGIHEPDREVTTLSKEVGYTVNINEVKEKLLQHFASIFDTQIIRK